MQALKDLLELGEYFKGERKFDMVNDLYFDAVNGFEYIRKIKDPRQRIAEIKKLLAKKGPCGHFEPTNFYSIKNKYFNDDDLYYHDSASKACDRMDNLFQYLCFSLLTEYMLVAYMEINGEFRDVYKTHLEECDGWGTMPIVDYDKPMPDYVRLQKDGALRYLHEETTYLKKK